MTVVYVVCGFAAFLVLFVVVKGFCMLKNMRQIQVISVTGPTSCKLKNVSFLLDRMKTTMIKKKLTDFLNKFPQQMIELF